MSNVHTLYSSLGNRTRACLKTYTYSQYYGFHSVLSAFPLPLSQRCYSTNSQHIGFLSGTSPGTSLTRLVSLETAAGRFLSHQAPPQGRHPNLGPREPAALKPEVSTHPEPLKHHHTRFPLLGSCEKEKLGRKYRR